MPYKTLAYGPVKMGEVDLFHDDGFIIYSGAIDETRGIWFEVPKEYWSRTKDLIELKFKRDMSTSHPNILVWTLDPLDHYSSECTDIFEDSFRFRKIIKAVQVFKKD